MARNRFQPPPPPRGPTVPLSEAKNTLVELLARGKDLVQREPTNEAKITVWKNHVSETLSNGLGEDHSDKHAFDAAGVQTVVMSTWGEGPDPGHYARVELTEKVQTLEAILESIEFKLKTAGAASPAKPPQSDDSRAPATEVFIVHGHDEATKTKVARVVERLGLVPVILHEQPNAGQTIIEKFEKHAGRAGYAIVLFTGDDIGKAKNAAEHLPRARQNVVLEFGYFVGRLGRKHVCALYEPDVDLPSDMLGVLYISLASGWELAVAKEIREAGYTIDFNRL